MYTKHFGLNKLPFENVPDPVFFFDEGDHARVRYRIEESLKAGRGLSVVSGHIGSGKTTISQMIKADFPSDVQLIWMAEPPGNSMDLFLFIAQELGLNPTSSEKTFVMRDIREALMKLNAKGNKCLVIIDEAHLISDDTINGIRLLNNLEEGSTKLIQILLLGQEELMEIINRPELEPFRQRIATMEMLGKMNTEGIRKYISHRLHVAGGEPTLFSDTGWEAIALAFGSGSTPRVINSLCDRALTVAYERKKTVVDVDDVYEAAQAMGLQKEIFFYKVSLKKGGKKEQPISAGPDDSSKDKEAVKPAPKTVPSVTKHQDVTYTEPLKRQAEPVRTIREESVTGVSAYETGKKDIKIPLIILIVSIIVFVLSLSYYCGKADSPDLITCLQELIGL